LASTAATASAAVSTAGAASGTASTRATSVPSAQVASASVALVDTVGESSAGFLSHYLVSPIALGFVLIYGASFWLYKTKRIRIATHRKIWNMLLLGTFLITGIFGTILTFQLDYAPMYVWPVNLLFWHVEAGVVMTFISLFHMAWHFKYYRGILKNARAKWRLLRDTQKESDLAEGRLVLEAREARRAEREVRKAGCEPAPDRRPFDLERGGYSEVG
jgi:hypothetical protein